MSQERPIFTVCVEGPKCSGKYLNDFKKRVEEFGAENQGTGNLCLDIEAAARERGIEVEVIPSACLELCPIPGERSTVIGPNRKVRRVYFEDVPKLFEGLG